MNIAFASGISNDAVEQQFFRYVADTSAKLLESGNKVFLFRADRSEFSGIRLPDGVIEIPVEIARDTGAASYLSLYHRYSDFLAGAVLDFAQTQPLDVIETPLWGAVGFSLIRAKRLLNVCSDTKLSVNAIWARMFDKTFESDFLENMVLSEMENYCVRYADVVSSPFETLGTCISQKCCRNDTRFYDATAIIEDICSAEIRPELRSIREFVQGYQPGYLPISPLEIFNLPGRKRYQRPGRMTSLSVIIPRTGSEDIELMISEFPITDGVEMQFLVWDRPSEEFSSRMSGILKRDGVFKSCISVSAKTLPELLDLCEGEYVVFYPFGVELTTEYLPRGILALERNSELAAISAYQAGSRYKQVFGAITGFSCIYNTLGRWGSLFRKSKLSQVAETMEGIDWTGDDWQLIVALVDRYQLMDVLPFTGVRCQAFLEDDYDATVRAKTLDILDRFPKCWTSSSSRLLRLILNEPKYLSWLSGSLDSEITAEVTLSLPSFEFIPKEVPHTVQSPKTEFFAGVTEAIPESEPAEMEGGADDLNSTSTETQNELIQIDEIVQDSTPDQNQMDGNPICLETGSELVELQSDTFISFSEEVSSQDSEWSEFPGVSELPKLGEENDENILPVIDSNEVDEAHLEKIGRASDLSDTEFGEEDPLDWFQVFWAEADAFSEFNSVTESYDAHETHTLEIKIDCDEFIRKIRLDPSNRPGKLSLRRIEIWDSKTHLPVFISSEENAFDNLTPCGDFEVEGIEHDSLILESIGRDPQIVLDLGESQVNHIILSIEFSFVVIRKETNF